ncbi:hypothetical protein ACIP44_26085 [Streptomyces diastaticus]|uniref:hypothetical protein n=1 Tax=Streptomyces diastaticus TaxID=1956 RepID=UPI0017843FAF|nr:hypothetical protein [Streptomyces diastaticus]
MERTLRQAAFVAPSERDESDRMRRAHAAAAKQFRVSASGPEVWGWHTGPAVRQPITEPALETFAL